MVTTLRSVNDNDRVIPEDFPTPNDVAMTGWTPGAETWPGKKLLTEWGINWQGQFLLSPSEPVSPPVVEPVKTATRAEIETALVNGTLRELNLVGADLSELDLTGEDLSEVNLLGANLQGATLNDANLSGAVLIFANLFDTDLTGASLTGTNLGGANLETAKLIDADLTRANLSRANLLRVDLSGADIEGANLIGAIAPTNYSDSTRTLADGGTVAIRFRAGGAYTGLSGPNEDRTMIPEWTEAEISLIEQAGYTKAATIFGEMYVPVGLAETIPTPEGYVPVSSLARLSEKSALMPDAMKQRLVTDMRILESVIQMRDGDEYELDLIPYTYGLGRYGWVKPGASTADLTQVQITSIPNSSTVIHEFGHLMDLNYVYSSNWKKSTETDTKRGYGREQKTKFQAQYDSLIRALASTPEYETYDRYKTSSFNFFGPVGDKKISERLEEAGLANSAQWNNASEWVSAPRELFARAFQQFVWEESSFSDKADLTQVSWSDSPQWSKARELLREILATAGVLRQEYRGSVNTEPPATRDEVVAALANGTLKNLNLSYANLSRLDLSGIDLSGFDLSDANLTEANLSGANLTYANLTRTNMPDANLEGANLKGANLTRAYLWDVNLSDANLAGATMTGTYMRGANLTGAGLLEADLTDANLTSADLRNAYLSRANLTGADLTGAELNDASLSEANLTNANLSMTYLTGADLTGTILTGADLTGAVGVDTGAAPAIVAAVKRPRLDVPVGGFDAEGNWHDPGNGQFARRGFSSWKRLAMEAMDAWKVVREDATYADGPVMARVGTNGLSRGGIKKGDYIEISYVDNIYGRVKAPTSGRSYNVKWTHFDDVKVLPDAPDAPDAPQGNRPELVSPPVVEPVKTATRAEIEAALANGTLRELNLVRADLSELDLIGEDLSGLNLLGANLYKATLSGANLSDTVLIFANLLAADISEADLTGANLTGANLEEAKFTEADLTRANLTRANLLRADLRGANLEGTNLSGADTQFNYMPSTETLFDKQLIGTPFRAGGGRVTSGANEDLAMIPEWTEAEIGLIEQAGYTKVSTILGEVYVPVGLTETMPTPDGYVPVFSSARLSDNSQLMPYAFKQKFITNMRIVESVIQMPEGDEYELDLVPYTRGLGYFGAVFPAGGLQKRELSRMEIVSESDNATVPHEFGHLMDINYVHSDNWRGFYLSKTDTKLGLTEEQAIASQARYSTLMKELRETPEYKMYMRYKRDPRYGGIGNKKVSEWLKDAGFAGASEWDGPSTWVEEPRELFARAFQQFVYEESPFSDKADLTQVQWSDSPEWSKAREVMREILATAGVLREEYRGSVNIQPPATRDEIETALATETLKDLNLAYTDLSGLDLSGMDLSGVDLSGANLTGTILSGANLSEANLRYANLDSSDLSGANLVLSILIGARVRSANLTGANLYGADMTGAVLERSNFTKASMYEVNLTGANLDEADMTGVNLLRATLSNALLRGTNLSGAYLMETYFDKAILTRAILTGADLTDANLSDANLERADLTGTNLTDANLIKARMDGANLTGATLLSTKLTDAELINANLTDATLTGVNLSGAELRRVNLSGTKLNRVRFTGADLSGVDLTVTDELNYATFEDANLRDAKMSGMDLSDTDMRNANLYGAVLDRANLTDTNLTGAVLSEAILEDANLSKAILRNADLRVANLRNANLFRADLDDADFTGANLTGANLRGTNRDKAATPLPQDDITPDPAIAKMAIRAQIEAALANGTLKELNLVGADLSELDLGFVDLSDTDLTGANLTGAKLFGTDLTGANLTDAKLTSADLRNAKLGNANLTNAQLTDANLNEADLSNANLTGATLYNASLHNANLSEANLQNAQLTKAFLFGANLTGANLQKANLTSATLNMGNLTGANLTGANLRGAKLVGSNLTNTDFTDADLVFADMTDAEIAGINLTNADIDKAKIPELLVKPTELPITPEVYESFLGAFNSDLGDGWSSQVDLPAVKVERSTARIPNGIKSQYVVTIPVLISDASGNDAGTARRFIVIGQPSDPSLPTDISVKFDYVLMKNFAKGKGFGTRFSAKSIESLAGLGIQKIRAKAYTDDETKYIGAYVWARQGWDWAEGTSLSSVITGAREWVNKQKQDRIDRRLYENGGRLFPQEMKSIDLSAEDGAKLLAMLTAVESYLSSGTPQSEWPDDLPTPNDIAMFGYEEGDVSWPGKDFLTGLWDNSPVSWEASLDLAALPAAPAAVV
jgi:uncharacterized protein YjbI with pentapeptide repeats